MAHRNLVARLRQIIVESIANNEINEIIVPDAIEPITASTKKDLNAGSQSIGTTFFVEFKLEKITSCTHFSFFSFISYLQSTTPLDPKIEAIPRLPWELERLVSAASNSVLPFGTHQLSSGVVPSLEKFVLGWAAAYLCGATTDALNQLWDVWTLWQDSKVTA